MPVMHDRDYRGLFESLPGLYLVLDPSLEIMAASDAYLAATLTVREEIVGRGIFDVFPDNPDDPDTDAVSTSQASFDRVRRDRAPDTMAVQRHDVEQPTGDGGGFVTRYWSPRNIPVLDEHRRLRYIVHQVEDVTEFVGLKARGGQHQAVAGELREQTERMEADIVRRSVELAEANRALHAASEAKNEFLSRMSHELRTPLASVMGFSELLGLSDLSADEHEWAAAILTSARHLLALVNEVLDISLMESGDLSLSLECVPIGPLVESALEMIRPLAETRGVVVHPMAMAPGSSYAMADAQRLKQVVINLLSNAVKYNRPGGDVRVTVAPHGDARLRIAIADTGLGLDQASLAKLFTSFERLDAGASGVEGTGLGLVLSRALVDAMGGHVRVDSTLGTGSTFTVELERSEPVAVGAIDDADHEALVPRAYSRERSMLYIEDTVANVRLIETILRFRPSVRLLPAMMGRLGLELAREHQPDLILLDLHLPDIGGGSVLAQLRADARTRDIPVVIFSADATKRTPAPLLEAGADAYLTKPISVIGLLEVIDRYMGN